jgi:hypothetical protein
MSNKELVLNRLIPGTIAAMLILALVFVGLSNSNNSIILAQRSFGPFGENRFYIFGMISSVQNDNSGKPAWILTGFWKTNLLNQTQTNIANTSAGAVFNTSFKMIMTNGSGMHTHTITNLVLKNKSMPNNSTAIFNGTATVSLKNGPVADVPISIKVMNNRIISIWLDEAKVNNHFGNTPIFGVIFMHDKGPLKMGTPIR